VILANNSRECLRWPGECSVGVDSHLAWSSSYVNRLTLGEICAHGLIHIERCSNNCTDGFRLRSKRSRRGESPDSLFFCKWLIVTLLDKNVLLCSHTGLYRLVLLWQHRILSIVLYFKQNCYSRVRMWHFGIFISLVPRHVQRSTSAKMLFSMLLKVSLFQNGWIHMEYRSGINKRPLSSHHILHPPRSRNSMLDLWRF